MPIFDSRKNMKFPRFGGSLPGVFLCLGLVALPLWYLKDYAKLKDPIFQNVYSGLVSSLVWTCVIIFIVLILGTAAIFQKRRKTAAFFGLNNADGKLTIFLSNIQIQKNATIALEEVNPGYWGCAVSRLEYQSAHAVREIITSKPLILIPSSGPEDWFSKINQRFGLPEVDIRVSPLPGGIKPDPGGPLASFQVSNKAHTKTENSKKILAEDGHYKDIGEKVTIALNTAAGDSGKIQENVVSIEANKDSGIITDGNEGEIVSKEDNPRRSVFYRWREDIREREDFWMEELRGCGSLFIIGSNIYNSVTKYYCDVFYENNKSNYRYFAGFESVVDDNKRRIVIREEDGQKAEGSVLAGKAFSTDHRGEPAIIMRVREKSIQEGEYSTYEERTVIICAGLTSMSTASAVHYLHGNWQHLHETFGDKDFAVILYSRKRKEEPQHIGDIEAGRFIESYELKPPKEPGTQ